MAVPSVHTWNIHIYVWQKLFPYLLINFWAAILYFDHGTKCVTYFIIILSRCPVMRPLSDAFVLCVSCELVFILGSTTTQYSCWFQWLGHFRNHIISIEHVRVFHFVSNNMCCLWGSKNHVTVSLIVWVTQLYRVHCTLHPRWKTAIRKIINRKKEQKRNFKDNISSCSLINKG